MCESACSQGVELSKGVVSPDMGGARRHQPQLLLHHLLLPLIWGWISSSSSSCININSNNNARLGLTTFFFQILLHFCFVEVGLILIYLFWTWVLEMTSSLFFGTGFCWISALGLKWHDLLAMWKTFFFLFQVALRWQLLKLWKLWHDGEKSFVL